LLVLACSSLPTTVAHAGGVAISQHLFGEDGWPRLVANHYPYNAEAVPTWKVCSPECGPTVAVATHGSYQPGPTAAGTTFEASTTVDGTTTTARSRIWGGRVTNTALPTLAGAAVVGQVVTPAAGTWAGGWGDDTSLLGVRACSTPTAEDCRAMNAASLQPGHPSQVIIDRAYTGWYIGAIERRTAAQSVFVAIGYHFPAGQISGLPAPRPGQTVSAGALIGPITDPSPAPPPESAPAPPFRPRVALRKRAARRGGSLLLGTLICSKPCVARVTLRHGTTATTRRIVVRHERASIRLWPGTFSRRATSLRVTTRFDGFSTMRHGTVRLPPRTLS